MTEQTASELLRLALEATDERGEKVPCAGRAEWISEDVTDRAEAARACRHCPLTALCAAAADEHREKFGVWAGVDRTPRPRRREGAA